MGAEQRVGARTRVGGFVLRGTLSAVALICAGGVVVGLSSTAAALPDRGLDADPSLVAIAVPAALPNAAVPQPSAPVQLPAAPAGPGPAAPPPPLPSAVAKAATPQAAFAAWAQRIAQVTGIPVRALEAYAVAQAEMNYEEPRCHLTWVTLAGIARVESNHGTYQGRTLLPNGHPSSPIIGIPLNGAPGQRSIAATAAGSRLDGDPVWDHAVGPFQFIPSTWMAWASDGEGKGYADPQNIDDAAMTAGRYLCADGRDLSKGSDWLNAIMSYNNAVWYVQEVYAGAQAYARATQGLT